MFLMKVHYQNFVKKNEIEMNRLGKRGNITLHQQIRGIKLSSRSDFEYFSISIYVNGKRNKHFICNGVIGVREYYSYS
jgi:hypothetical protein